jgi:hypothetical protein
MTAEELQRAVAERRIGEVVVSIEALARWLTPDRVLVTREGIPAGALVLSARVELATREVILQVVHPSLPRCVERAVAPRSRVVVQDADLGPPRDR